MMMLWHQTVNGSKRWQDEIETEDNDAPNENFLFLMVSIKKILELTLWHLVVSIVMVGQSEMYFVVLQ